MRWGAEDQMERGHREGHPTKSTSKGRVRTEDDWQAGIFKSLVAQRKRYMVEHRGAVTYFIW